MKKSIKFLFLCLILCLLFSTNATRSSAKAKISQKKLSILVSEKKDLQITNNRKKVKWTSSNKSIVTVNKKGQVKGKKAGKAYVTGTVEGKKYKCKVTVKVGIDKKSIVLKPGKTTKIKLCGDKIKKAKSSDNKIAKVSSKGKVTAVSSGKCNIYIYGKNKKKYTCKVNVNKNYSPSNEDSSLEDDNSEDSTSDNYTSQDDSSEENVSENESPSESSSDNKRDSDKNESKQNFPDSENTNEKHNESGQAKNVNNDNTTNDSSNNDSINVVKDNYITIDKYLEDSLKKERVTNSDSRKNIVINSLKKLGSKKMIDEKSIHYDDKTNSIIYKSISGGVTIINFNPIDDSVNGSAIGTNTKIDIDGMFDDKKNTNYSMKIFMGFSGRPRTSATMTAEWNELGIDVSTKKVNTVDDFKSPGLSDIYMISAHGGIHYFNNEYYNYIMTPEKISSKRDKYYKSDLDNGLVYRIEFFNNDNTFNVEDSGYAISAEFIRKYYANSIKEGSLVLMENCMGFGTSDRRCYELADAFRECGAGSVVGFVNNVNSAYSLDFFKALLGKMLVNKMSTQNAYNEILKENNRKLANDSSYNSTEKKKAAYPTQYGSISLDANSSIIIPKDVTGTIIDFLQNDFDNDGVNEAFIVTSTEKKVPTDRSKTTFFKPTLWYIDNGKATKVNHGDGSYKCNYYYNCRSYKFSDNTTIVSCSYNRYNNSNEDISDEVFVYENGAMVSKGVFGLTHISGDKLVSTIRSSYVNLYHNSKELTEIVLKYKYEGGNFIEVSDNNTYYTYDDVEKIMKKYYDRYFIIDDRGDHYQIDFYSDTGHHSFEVDFYKASGLGFETNTITDYLSPTSFIDFSSYK